MRVADFAEPFPGSLIPMGEDLWAFRPNPLPRSLELPARLQLRAAEAEKAIGRLGGLLTGGGSPLSHYLVTRPLQRREAIESSRIEGTFTTPEQLVLFEDDANGDTVEDGRDETREVQNYMLALDWALAQIDTLPISARLIRGVHERLLRGVRGGDQQPGEFRNVQNFIGHSEDPKHARFVPPPPGLLPDLISEFERYIHIPKEQWELLRLVRIALIHYQFEAMHPFRDGNGRVGRILIPLLLKADDPMDPPLYLSAYFEQHRTEYYDHLLRVSQRGAFVEWIEFFLDAVIVSVNTSLQLAERLLTLRATYHQMVVSKDWPAAFKPLIDGLFERPVLTIKKVESAAGVSTPTASSYVKKLEEAGIITEHTGRTRNRVYVARQLLRTIHEP